MPSSQGRLHGGVIASYVLAALSFAWPLPLHFSTHLTGPPDGDTGVYVWNQWVFRHEIVDHGSLPYFTDAIFSLTGGANLSLHNFTTVPNLVALPLIGPLGVVAAFNAVYLAMSALTAYVMFLLARHLTGRTAESFLAGLLFAWSPVLVTRGAGHFSLAAAAPLVGFVLTLLRIETHQRPRDAVMLGLTFWWAASTDAYFAIYCLMLAAVFLVSKIVTIQHLEADGRRSAPWALDILLGCAGCLVAALLVSDGWQFSVFGHAVRVRGLYTPVLLLTTFALLRCGWRYRARLIPIPRAAAWRWARLAATATAVAALLLSPVLYALAQRIVSGKYESPVTFWRSSPAGIDLVSFLLPNPNHPFSPSSIRDWVTARPDAFIENVAGVPLVALAVVFAAWWAGWRPSRPWVGVAVCFGMLALGPFIQVAGINTYVPGPWALLRYVPIVEMARTPTRFSIVLMLALAVLFAMALSWLTARHASRRRPLLAAVGVLLAFELLPAPRPLWSAAIPPIYDRVASAPIDARVLELPFGVRDGTSSAGDFTARTQFYQTYHHRHLAGGYLSRVSRKTLADIRGIDMLDALITLSEGGRLDPLREQRLVHDGSAFAREANLAFVIIDSGRTTAALRSFAMRAFGLEFLESDGDLSLYQPTDVAHPRPVEAAPADAAHPHRR